MLFNKETRLKYLGFNDLWFSIIGIIILTITIFYILADSSGQLSTLEIIVSLLGTLFFSASDWFTNRSIIILLRKKYPKLSDSKQRNFFLF